MSENRPTLQFGWIRPGWIKAGEEIPCDVVTIAPDHPEYEEYLRYYLKHHQGESL